MGVCFFSLRTLLPCKSLCQLRLGRVICSSGELDVTHVELFLSRIMSDHYPDDSSVFLFFDVVFSLFLSFTEVHLDCDD